MSRENSLDWEDLLGDIGLEEWLDAHDIPHKRSGARAVNIRECPFCGDRRWKVYLNRDTFRGICYHGDCPKGPMSLFSFARQHLGISAREAIERFQRLKQGRGVGPRKTEPAPIAASAPVMLPASLPLPLKDGRSLRYLLERGITAQTQQLFGLRWCRDGEWRWHDGKAERVTDFSNRVIIPVFDLDGSLGTFQGRSLQADAWKRYIFPANLPGSGRFLYGGNLVRGAAHLVMGEGPFDVMRLHQALASRPGTGAIGSFGLTISSGENGDDQVERLRRLAQMGAKRLTIMWDGEQAALRHALEQGMKVRRRLGMAVHVALLPPGLDPGDAGDAAILEALDGAQELNELTCMALMAGNPYR